MNPFLRFIQFETYFAWWLSGLVSRFFGANRSDFEDRIMNFSVLLLLLNMMAPLIVLSKIERVRILFGYALVLILTILFVIYGFMLYHRRQNVKEFRSWSGAKQKKWSRLSLYYLIASFGIFIVAVFTRFEFVANT